MVRYNPNSLYHRMDVNRGRAFIDRHGNLVPIPTPSPIRRRMEMIGIRRNPYIHQVVPAPLPRTPTGPRRRPLSTRPANTRPAIDIQGLSKKK